MRAEGHGQPRTPRSYVWPLSFLAWVGLFVALFAIRPRLADSLGGAVENVCTAARGGGRQCFDARWTFTDEVASAHPFLTWFLSVPSLMLGLMFVAGIACWIIVAAVARRRARGTTSSR